MTDRVRRVLAVLLAIAMTGTLTELLLFGHDEDAAQIIPLALLVVAGASLGWMMLRPQYQSVRLFQLAMLMLIAGGLVGIALHFRANMEFQLELDASLDRWSLMKKVLRAKAPPALAPGSMAQFGLLGLVLSYKHPSLASRR